MSAESGKGRFLLSQFVDPWLESLRAPEESQMRVLATLLEGYAKTGYGARRNAGSIKTLEDYRRAFEVVTYRDLIPYFERVKSGEPHSILPEPLSGWVMTRGSTGRPKVIPVTETHLSQILALGARCVTNFALRMNEEVLELPVLNLNFPSNVHALPDGSSFGYSSGTYARLFPELGGARLIPSQVEVDSLGGGVTRADWEKRFELAFQQACNVDVGCLMGVTPVLLEFARFVKRRHARLPRDFWRPRAIFCTSVSKIQTRYKPELQRFFGPSPVIEMYTATEGVFGQQLDNLPYISPNYDGYLFEVLTRRGPKMLYELSPNEWGSLVVSTNFLPRYAIGDLVESMGKGYFRVFGRDKILTRLEHWGFNAMTLRF